MRKQIALGLCICTFLALSACTLGKTEESKDSISSLDSSLEESSTSDLQKESSSSVASEEETRALRIYYDLFLSDAYVLDSAEIFYDGEKGLYYTETAFGESYTLLQPQCEGYEFSCWKVANDTGVTFVDGVYGLETDIYLIATWTGKVIDSPFA